MVKYRFIVSIFLILAGGFNPALAEPVTSIRENGDPSNRVDIVILGDGYTADELAKYASDVEKGIDGFLSQEPFNAYQNYFNVHRVDVISNESGADHPENRPPVYKDTAFDATYNCANIRRLICVNTSKIYRVLDNSVAPNQKDIILVIVNDPIYGGSGGAIAVASTNDKIVELVLHEIGHSFGLLADEYDYGTCNDKYEPSQVNVTRETNRNLIKWNIDGGPPMGWIEINTLVPTASSSAGVPGLYEGAKYCPTVLHRPTFNSKMRSLNVPFEQINEEQLVKRIYNWVSPLDSSAPEDDNLKLAHGRSQEFMVAVPDPHTHKLEINWHVDEEFRETGLRFNLDSDDLSTGTHIVKVEVWDPTDKVRFDPASVLREQRSWTVQIILLGDVEGDDDVDGRDLAKLIRAITIEDPKADLTQDGDINVWDVAEFALDFGKIE